MKTKDCIICGKEFRLKRSGRYGVAQRDLVVRMRSALTCSRKCAKVYRQDQKITRLRVVLPRPAL